MKKLFFGLFTVLSVGKCFALGPMLTTVILSTGATQRGGFHTSTGTVDSLTASTAAVTNLSVSTLTFSSSLINGTATNNSTTTFTGTSTFSQNPVFISSAVRSTQNTGTGLQFRPAGATNGIQFTIDNIPVYFQTANDWEITPDTSATSNFIQATESGGMFFQGRPNSSWQLGSAANKWTAIFLSSGVVGTTTNNSAAVGFVGEYISSAVSTPTLYPTSGQFGDLASVSLTAGDWILSGNIRQAANGATITDNFIGISVTAGNSSTGLTNGTNSFDTLPATATVDSCASIPSYRQSLSGTTTVYLKYSATYSVATPKATGIITALRTR